jgi:hypothetical protein
VFHLIIIHCPAGIAGSARGSWPRRLNPPREARAAMQRPPPPASAGFAVGVRERVAIGQTTGSCGLQPAALLTANQLELFRP